MADWFSVVVLERREDVAGIVTFDLVAPDGVPLPPFTAGSHIEVRLGDLIRHYSLANAPGDAGRYLLGVLRESDGRGGSRSLCDGVREGGTLWVRGPHSHFELADSRAPSLLLAGGIGITPLLSMSEHLWATGRPFELHYCTRSARTTAFKDRLDTSPFAHRVMYHFDEDTLGGRPDLAAILKRASPETHLYVCGPARMIDSAVALAEQSGWPTTHIHVERFAATGAVDVGSESRPFWVQIKSSGQKVRVENHKSVVQALREIGIRIDISCESGACGTCITGVLEGVPEHRDSVLTDEEHAANLLFTPCCSRAVSDILVLDL